MNTFPRTSLHHVSTQCSTTGNKIISSTCFWPPDSCAPRSPTTVWYPSGKLWMNSCAFASFAASITCRCRRVSHSASSKWVWNQISGLETYFFISRRRFAITDIFLNSGCEEHRLLGNQSNDLNYRCFKEYMYEDESNVVDSVRTVIPSFTKV